MRNKKELTFTKKRFEKSKFFNDEDANYWVKRGKPIVWVEEYNENGVKAYSDIGYGYLKLIVDGEETVSGLGQSLTNKDYILLSSYYGDEYQGAVFKRVN